MKNSPDHTFKPARRFELIDRNFRKNPRPYFIQSLLAMAAVAVIIFFITTVTHAAIVAALGSSTFVAFAMPRYATAQPRRLIGGHLIGIMCGLTAYYLLMVGLFSWLPGVDGWAWILAAAVSVGLSIFLMPVFNAEHPPAAGTALGVAAVGWQWETVLFIVLFTVLLSMIRWLLLSRLKDLV